MHKITISKEEARRFLICYQGLDSSSTFNGEKGILEYIKRVGCIQYDPLDVVGRNPDLVLQSRISGYSKTMLEKLLYADRVLIDGWDKMMSIYRQDDWPFFRLLRKQKGKEITGILKRRASSEAVKLTGEIRERLIQRGPRQAAHINLGEAGKGRWGHRNLSGAAMDYMFNIGEIGIYGKKGSQKIYDLIEDLLPHELLNCPDPFTSERDFCKWYFKRRVGSIGLIWERNGGGWLGQFLSDKVLRTSILTELVEEKSLITISIEGIDEAFYMRQEDFIILDSINIEKKAGARFLAPLDNFLWDREMIEKIFNFKYSWEVYLPVTKQKYGYEVWVRIGGEIVVNDSLVKTKTFQGGLYAVCGVKDLTGGGDGLEIHDTWQRFSRWINESKYVAADHQWIEEHLHFNDEFEHTGGMDLYMPIAPKESISKIEKEIVFVEPMKTVTMSFNGRVYY